MKREIIKIMRQADRSFVSGQKLCEELGVTRQAVWKNIVQLREAGYQIESVTNRGYRLLGVPDRLYGPDIESRLPEQNICQRVEFHEILDSTNTRAKQLAEQGGKEGTLVIAEQQSSGKGRRGKNWESKAGDGIWMTLLLRPNIRPVQASSITLVAALAVAGAVRRVCRVEVGIKWPNDIVLQGKKLCGILTEMSSELDFIHYVVVGIGINANTVDFPDELQKTATSLFIQTGSKCDRQELTAEVMKEFDKYYRVYLETADLSKLQEEYNTLLINNNREVAVYYGSPGDASFRIEKGIARGIDADGALLVDMDGERKKILSGEVSVRGVYGYV